MLIPCLFFVACDFLIVRVTLARGKVHHNNGAVPDVVAEPKWKPCEEWIQILTALYRSTLPASAMDAFS